MIKILNIKYQISNIRGGKYWRWEFPARWRGGQSLIIAVITLTVVLILAAALFARVANFIRFGLNSNLKEQATNLAEAGVDYALFRLNQTGGSYSGDSDQAIGTTGVFTVQVAPKSLYLKSITATGYVPNSSKPLGKRTIKVDAVVATTPVSFRYAVQVGDGGLDMSNSATVNGNVYANGSITAGNGNQQKINGEAWAKGSIDSPPITVQQLPLHPNASPTPLPDISDAIQQGKVAAADGGTVDCAATPTLCEITNSGNIGPKKYINGNLLITSNATVIMKGPIWVANGNFSMSQGGTSLKLDDSLFCSLNAVLYVEGTINLTQGGTLLPAVGCDPKGYIMLVSNSTSSQAITVSQTGTTAFFYALNGGGELTQTANVISLVAKNLTMKNSAVLNYDQGLADAKFSVGPGGTWVIKKGTYRFATSP